MQKIVTVKNVFLYENMHNLIFFYNKLNPKKIQNYDIVFITKKLITYIQKIIFYYKIRQNYATNVFISIYTFILYNIIIYILYYILY